MSKVLELSCGIFCLSHKKEGLLALFSHAFFTFQKCLHDFFEFFLQGVGFTLEQLVAFTRSSDFLLVKLHVPALEERYIRLAVICWLMVINRIRQILPSINSDGSINKKYQIPG